MAALAAAFAYFNFGMTPAELKVWIPFAGHAWSGHWYRFRVEGWALIFVSAFVVAFLQGIWQYFKTCSLRGKLRGTTGELETARKQIAQLEAEMDSLRQSQEQAEVTGELPPEERT